MVLERMCEVGIYRRDSWLWQHHLGVGSQTAAQTEVERRYPGRRELFAASKRVLARMQSQHVHLEREEPPLDFSTISDDDEVEEDLLF